MLTIKIPDIRQNELRYAIDLLLDEFLGLNFEVKVHKRDFIEITKKDDFKKFSILTLDASFFHKAKDNWLNIKSMPILPLEHWTPIDNELKANLVKSSIPILYGCPKVLKKGNHIHLNFDILGSIFFMLSRFEELSIKYRDNHNRFPSWASISLKEPPLSLMLMSVTTPSGEQVSMLLRIASAQPIISAWFWKAT